LLDNFDYEVCNCQKVTVKMIIDAIKNKEAKTLGEIQELTKAGTGCRHCIIAEGDFGKMKKKIYCKDVLAKVLNG
jgi:bacterioferritin-associated ferredoxin